MQIVVFIRSIYKETVTPLRLQLLSEYVIPAWRDQTVTDFTLVMLVHKNTASVIKSLSWEGINVKFIECQSHELKDIIKEKAFTNIALPEDREVIQVRYDDDDYPNHNFIALLTHQFEHGVKKLVTFHPTKFVLKTGERYLSQTSWYGGNKPTNCIAIHDPFGKRTVFHTHHPRMGDSYWTEKEYIKVFGLHNMIIHSENQLNRP